MRERFGAQRPELDAAPVSLPDGRGDPHQKAQPMVNVVRTAFQALSAVLGGAQSLHTNGLPTRPTRSPSEEAMKLALRTQQVVAEETGVPEVIDPLGGSYYVEALTNRIEADVMAILRKVEAMGGTIRAIEEGYFQPPRRSPTTPTRSPVARRQASSQ